MLKLKRIETIDELLELAPSLLTLHKTLSGKWEPFLTPYEFCQRLIDKFSEAHYFGELEDDKLLYFAALLPLDDKVCKVWVFYSDVSIRASSKDLVWQLIDFAKSQGFTSLESNTTRLTRSYDRWIRSFGAKPVFITYQLPL